MRPQALALSPDGRILVAAGKTPEIIVMDPANGADSQACSFAAGGAGRAGRRLDPYLATR